MLGLLGELIAQGRLKVTRENILLFENPICLIPLKIIVRAVKSIHESDDPSILYRASRDETIAWLESMKKNYGLKEEHMIEWGLKIESMAGWGTVEVHDIKLKEKFVVSKLQNSTTAREYVKIYGLSKYPVDDVVRGLHAGASSMVHHAEMEAIEHSCVGKGDVVCAFEIKKRAEFDFNDPEIIRQIGKMRQYATN